MLSGALKRYQSEIDKAKGEVAEIEKAKAERKRAEDGLAAIKIQIKQVQTDLELVTRTSEREKTKLRASVKELTEARDALKAAAAKA